jgi:hypothetical protein
MKKPKKGILHWKAEYKKNYFKIKRLKSSLKNYYQPTLLIIT